jgi:5-methylcytosine-specific restriction protein B
VDYKYFDFQGARQQGSDRFWLAIYNKDQESHSSGLQFFVNFQNGMIKYGIYRHSDQTYIKGIEERTASDFDFEALISMFEQNKELILQDEPKQDRLVTIDLADKKLFKMSHGSFKAKSKESIREIFKQNNWIVLHETTRNGQAERFKNGLNAGDLVYITLGGDELFAIAKIKPGQWEYVPEDITNETGWIYREVEYLRSAIKSNPSELKKYRKDIYPSGNSTLSEIKPLNLNEANANIFRPYFGVEFISGNKTISEIKKPEITDEDLPKFPCNIILYGPPGTGKTFNTIDRAVKIITGNSATHEENKIIFDDLREEGQIEFVTFHQNYGYEDFMIGIRPDLDGSDLKFGRTEGIFYRLCKRAEQNYLQSKNMIDTFRPFDEVFAEFIEPLEKDGTEIEINTLSGKSSFWITEINPNNIGFRKQSGGTAHKLNIDTIQGLYEGKRSINGGLGFYYGPIINELREKGRKIETQVPLKRYVLIIDEINRANISKVFGELITLLEEDKRIDAKNELKISLSNGEVDFGVPSNLYLIGTMNTADKSIALIDIALRRRFEFIGCFPDSSKIESEESRTILEHVNKRIYERKKSADYLIGHGYFMDGTDIQKVIRNKVIPLLMEYFSGKTEVVEDIFRESGWSVKYDAEKYDWQIQQ